VKGADEVQKEKKPRAEALQYLWDRYIGDAPRAAAEYEQALFETEAARLIYDLRTAAGLSQRALAKKVGTTASVICRLEDADYEGHSLAMLRRIGAALGKRVEIRFVPAGKARKGRGRSVA
jgi:ribosome-binding protein aMBF1 (putative translation factor)